MYAHALRSLLVAHVVLHTPGVKLTPTRQRRDASLGELLRTLQSSRNDTTFWTSERNETCGIPVKELAVHLSTVPNSGTTWTQFLFEEATGIITQSHGNSSLGHRSTCRLKEAVSSSTARFAMNDELELFKTHYPGLPGKQLEMIDGMDWEQSIFVPSNPQYAVSRALVVVRNPIDAFFAIAGHLSPQDADKVSVLLNPGAECLTDEAETRTELIGEWLDPEGYNAHSNIATEETEIETEYVFRSYFKLWVRFVTYWFQHSSSACVDITMVRYEDLSDIDRNLDTISVLMDAFNSSVSSNAIERATLTYPPSSTSSTCDVYTNATCDETTASQAFASVCLEESELMSALGYNMFLEHRPRTTTHYTKPPRKARTAQQRAHSVHSRIHAFHLQSSGFFNVSHLCDL